jgi:hypothetical protein
MARKTIKKPNKRLSGNTRRRRRDTPAAPAVESHRFVSSITFDGNKIVKKSQKDNEPVKQQIYTMKQLEQELPIGKELIDIHLDGKMPRGIQEHHRNKHKTPMFRNVLVHPADLGLLAPKVDVSIPDKHRSRSRSRRHRHRHERPRDDNLRLMVDTDTDTDADADAAYGIQHQRPRNLFDLP